MAKRHIRDRKLKPLETAPIKVETPVSADLEGTIKTKLEKAGPVGQNVASILGLPPGILELANVSSKELDEAVSKAGEITKGVSLLNMRNPVMQGAGALGLAYALKPELAKSFLKGGLGSSLVGGLGALAIGNNVGKMVGNSFTLSTTGGAASGFAFGAALGVPVLGLLAGGIGGAFGFGSSKRAKRKRRAKLEAAWEKLSGVRKDALAAQDQLAATAKARAAAFDDFLDRTEIARQRLLLGKDAIATQQKNLIEKRDINLGIIAQNTKEIERVANLRDENIRRETEKLLSRQRAQLLASGRGLSGSAWYITGETEAMGARAQQEVYFERKAALAVQERKYRELMTDYSNMSAQLADYASGIDLEIRGLESGLKKTRAEYEAGLTEIENARNKLVRNTDELTEAMHGVAHEHDRSGGADLALKAKADKKKYRNTLKYSSFAAEHKLLEKAEQEAGALASLGSAIKATGAGINPFDALVNYRMFK